MTEEKYCPRCKSYKLVYLDEEYGYVYLKCRYIGKIWLEIKNNSRHKQAL